MKPTFSGCGLGLRPTYYGEILERLPPIDWFEIISENYLVPGGKPLYFLDRIREHYPMTLHGVSLSIGSSDPLNTDYLRELKTLIQRVEPLWVSDHLCWTGCNAHNSHDLLPLPYNEETVRHVAGRVRQVQDYLGRRIALENLSSYVDFKASTMTEWEFVSAVAEAADCWLLLDVNNIHVSARNHGFDALDYLDGIPWSRVVQMHVAGHHDYGRYIIDTHDAPVADSVWILLAEAFHRGGPIATMIERDDQFPPFDELLEELAILRRISEEALSRSAYDRPESIGPCSVGPHSVGPPSVGPRSVESPLPGLGSIEPHSAESPLLRLQSAEQIRRGTEHAAG